MRNIASIVIFSLILIFVSSPALSMKNKLQQPTASSIITSEMPKELDETCLDEYAIRNAYLKKFIIWAPPTVIVSLPIGSFAYLLGVYGLLTIAPYEILFVTGFGLWYLGTPIIAGLAITYEIKYTVEYFGNRSIVRVLDALRTNKFENKHVKKLLKKFRKKHPTSSLSNSEVFSEILSLDKKGSLCNGDLTGSNSDKIRKLLAKKKHLIQHLGNL